MSAKILILDGDSVTRNWLKSLLERENYTVSTAEGGQAALDQITHEQPDLLVMDPVLADMDGLKLLRRLRQDPALQQLRVIVLSRKASPEDMVAGLSAGADDYLAKRPGADVDLVSKIRVVLAMPRGGSPAPQAPSGQVFAFCSGKGGTGTTSVCINAAYAMARLEPSAQVLVVDMVLPVGTVGSSVGYESERTIAQLTQAQGEMDRALVAQYVSPPTRWGFRVLLSTRDPQEATQLEASQIVPLFDTLRTMYDYVFADFGRTLSRVSLPVMRTAQRVVLILGSDVNNVKLTKSMLDYFQSLGISRDRLLLIANRTVGRVWISKEEIEQELSLSLAGTIPHETEHMTLAINAGTPFMAKFPERTASIAFADLARLLHHRQ
jgi:DNA-binding response OmpR family regulator